MSRIMLSSSQFRALNFYRRFLTNVASPDTGTQSTSDQGDIRQKLLDASLPFVPSTGWTSETLELGAKELKYPPVMQGLFQDVGASLVHHFILSSNARLVEHMKLERNSLSKDTSIGFALFVGSAVKRRLEMNIPYMEHMAEALSIATRPDQLPQSLNLLVRMCDDICYYAGDRSTDFSWYTKRTSLAAVYAATEVYMLQDKSADFEDTWQFMLRRFDDLKSVGQPLKQVNSIINTINNVAYSFYAVGRNAIGANVQSRK